MSSSVTKAHSLINLNGYIGGFVSRLISLGTRWNMHASRKILLKHFDARAAEYRNEMNGGDNMSLVNPEQADKPVRPFFPHIIVNAMNFSKLTISRSRSSAGSTKAQFSANDGATPKSSEKCSSFNSHSSTQPPTYIPKSTEQEPRSSHIIRDSTAH